MFTLRNFKALFLLSASLLLFHPDATAQSGRNPSRPKSVPGMQPEPATTPASQTQTSAR